MVSVRRATLILLLEMQFLRTPTGPVVPARCAEGSDRLHANPRFTGGSDDEAVGDENGRPQERQERENMTMSQERPATTSDQREEWIDVTVAALPDLHLVRLTSTDGDVEEYTTAEADDLAAAAEHTAGSAQWCAKYRQLLVPGATAATGRHPFFKLHPASLPLSA
ncbi:hypothetical protein KFL01_12320 [Kocuria flava]|uniref:Uncharacterized protein n=2 Tax=Kocuria flava TaxID=446860 RepID=A0ABQ0X2Q3_9MICC|nr:hypothetical protein KFL01_12320 [Kocuria flava]